MATLDITEIERAGPNLELVVLALRGEVDAHTISELKNRFAALNQPAIRYIVLNMSETSYVNSSALAVLVKSTHALRERGGGIALTNVHARVRLPFEMLGLLRFFQFFDSVAAAKAALFGDL